MVEFVQHYIEEGADHVFIYDDGSTDGTRESLMCIDSQYWSLYGVLDMKNPGLSHEDTYARMYSPHFVNARNQSKFVIIADVDEFISTRAQPHRNLRELLETDLVDCGIIMVPWQLYSHGSQIHSPRNMARYALNWRWVLEEEYAVGESNQAKFRDRHGGVEVKIIVRSEVVPHVAHAGRGSVHYSSFHGNGLVCVPRWDGPMSCAANLTAEELDLDAVSLEPFTYKGGKYVSPIVGAMELAPWCPYSNRFIAHTSLPFLLMHEIDIEHMQLLAYHYRIKSAKDLLRKSGHDGNKREFSDMYDAGDIKHINRMDKFDDFMTTVRKPARLMHPDFLKAQNAVRSCPAEYFSVSGLSETSGAEEISVTGFRWHL